MSYVYLMVAVVLVSVGQILQKMTAERLDSELGSASSLVTLIRSPLFWQTALVMAGSLAAWLLALADLQVSKAYPILGLSFSLTTVSSVFFLGENVTPVRWLGVALISIGAAIMLGS